nr:hypothetical protein [Methanofollis ethanolicus]
MERLVYEKKTDIRVCRGVPICIVQLCFKTINNEMSEADDDKDPYRQSPPTKIKSRYKSEDAGKSAMYVKIRRVPFIFGFIRNPAIGLKNKINQQMRHNQGKEKGKTHLCQGIHPLSGTDVQQRIINVLELPDISIFILKQKSRGISTLTSYTEFFKELLSMEFISYNYE